MITGIQILRRRDDGGGGGDSSGFRYIGIRPREGAADRPVLGEDSECELNVPAPEARIPCTFLMLAVWVCEPGPCALGECEPTSRRFPMFFSDIHGILATACVRTDSEGEAVLDHWADYYGIPSSFMDVFKGFIVGFIAQRVSG